MIFYTKTLSLAEVFIIVDVLSKMSRPVCPQSKYLRQAGLPKPRPVPDTERTKDTKTLDYASTPLDANTV
jgi:hypothetical protein